MSLEKIYAVDSVDLTLLKSNPPQLLIEVMGRVPSSGWSSGSLIPYAYVMPPADRIQDFDVVAEAPRPGVIVLPVLTPIRIEHVLPSVDIESYWGAGMALAGVRCHATANTKIATFEQREGMPAALTIRAEDIASYSPVGPSGPSFAEDIKPLFRPRDVNVMRAIGGFDLHDYDDVKTNVDKIFARLSDGTMPCDGPWPQSDIELFKSWMDAGMQA
jgi:hypothetical protein